MGAKPEYRDRDETELAVLDALADRPNDGMTVFELRASTDEDIEALETALAELKADDLIEVSNDDGRTVIVPDDRVVETPDDSDEPDIFDEIRRHLPF